MKEKILNYLKNINSAVSHTTIAETLNLSKSDEEELAKLLVELQNESEIISTKKGKYMHISNTNRRVGYLSANAKGFGFVNIIDAPDIFIPPNAMENAIHGDKVLVELLPTDATKPEGKVLKVLERDKKVLVGEFYRRGNENRIKIDDPRVNIKVNIRPKNVHGAVDGSKVLVRLYDQQGGNVFNGDIIKVLGHKNDPGMDILSVLYSNNMSTVFPKKVMEEVDAVPSEVLESDLEGRRDLRNKKIFTIDGADAKDLDDGISIEKLEDGTYLLGVHIADVSHYVKEGSKIDEEAYARGTSVYLADRVVPMLPHALSNGVCSLHPDVDRLTLSCEMKISSEGKVISSDTFTSVINSKNRMTYEDANKVISGEEIPKGYEDFVEELKISHELSLKIRKYKEKRGMLDFNIDEAKILVDDKGEATDVVLRERGEAEKIIEDFMVAANESVATLMTDLELPFVYRVHGEPSEEKIEKFLKFVRLLGHKVDNIKGEIRPHEMQNILRSLQEKKEFLIFSRLLLRSMQKAIYDTHNIGHFGLASEKYTHFTSPIRRYPDLVVHRLVKAHLNGKIYDENVLNAYESSLPEIAEHTSEMEQKAVQTEREVDDMKKAEYMKKHIGEIFDGMVTSVQSFGMFVELENLIEGLISLDEINASKNDRYHFDEATLSMKSQNDPRGIRLGDDLKIVVKGANKEERKIDFAIYKEEEKEEKGKSR